MKRPSLVKIMIPFGSSPNVGILMPSGRTVSLEISIQAPTRSLAVCATAVLGAAGGGNSEAQHCHCAQSKGGTTLHRVLLRLSAEQVAPRELFDPGAPIHACMRIR